MTIREILAANFQALRDATPKLNTPTDLVNAKAASNGTIHRIVKNGSGTRIDTLEPLANAYGLEVWQMLLPTLRVSPGKHGKPIITGMPGWPFSPQLQKRIENLPEAELIKCENALRVQLDMEVLRPQTNQKRAVTVSAQLYLFPSGRPLP